MDVVGSWGWYHLAFFGLLLPVFAFRTRLHLDRVLALPKRQFLATVLVQQGIFLTVSLLVARHEGIVLFPAAVPSPPAWLAGAALFAASWAIMRPAWREQVARGEPQARLAMPGDRTERALWAGVSLAAGVGEELSYRGVVFTLLDRLLGDPVAATLGMAILFGLAHAVQGWRGVTVTAVYAVIAQALVLWSGSLYVAMAWHVAYDVVAGLSYAGYGRDMGLLPGRPADEPARPPEGGGITRR